MALCYLNLKHFDIAEVCLKEILTILKEENLYDTEILYLLSLTKTLNLSSSEKDIEKAKSYSLIVLNDKKS